MTGEADSDAGAQPSVWRYAMATRAHLVIDAADYFDVIRDAMCSARQRIFVIGWDFDTRILLSAGRRWWHLPRKGRFPARLGSFVIWLARHTPGLEILILKWNFSLFKSLFRGTMIIDLLRWLAHPAIRFKFDAAHPLGCSHHQKIVVIDDKLAACGGIDMTSDRWDTREHIHHDPRRKRPTGSRYDPWHDATMLMEGDVAQALAELGRERWQAAGGRDVPPCRPQAESPWPARLEAEFHNVEIGIARTRAKYGDYDQICEVEALFVEQIARARKFVYAETQYFASRRIAEAICERLVEPDPPEFLLINAFTADGWLSQVAMDSARVQLVNAVRQVDHAGRLRIYVPYTSGGTPIYVHAKITIFDDEIVRVGSANMNNRSMGLDSECDVFIDTARPANAAVGPTITRMRHSLLAEHCGIPIEDVAAGLERHGTMAAMIDALPKTGKHLEPLRLQVLSDAERALANGEVLDPERPEEMFEPINKRGLFRRPGHLRRIWQNNKSRLRRWTE
ncbi:phospholipase D-like domain-containing protein [Novosphingobium album (ex Liu et al. 2023)]|uniref:Phospholipase D n=1 Tax=Novosphingobium album (ex Liu et al. 2023) TaxID=3031130 RepID=A0ABT5WXD9_9SPHN|nr:phospholipase D-like domain-containing protein [Novosphingobium album (ex Liu et al. 2023)]MDE8654544.1 phospholipase D-like domain-containing protein [Novosphingobium album (ex Liu et al. 2023)]